MLSWAKYTKWLIFYVALHTVKFLHLSSEELLSGLSKLDAIM